jgi:MFS family permease
LEPSSEPSPARYSLNISPEGKNLYLFRQGLLIINIFAIVVGGLIFIENFYSLLIFRLLQGFAVGLGSSLSPVIIK